MQESIRFHPVLVAKGKGSVGINTLRQKAGGPALPLVAPVAPIVQPEVLNSLPLSLFCFMKVLMKLCNKYIVAFILFTFIREVISVCKALLAEYEQSVHKAARLGKTG
jgi:hypothetical protein